MGGGGTRAPWLRWQLPPLTRPWHLLLCSSLAGPAAGANKAARMFVLLGPRVPGCRDGVLLFWGHLSPWQSPHGIEGARG